MQNKRGISQAFSGPAGQDGILIRQAIVFDVFDISRVLIASITDLCSADHGNDPTRLAPWIADKSPQHVREWLSAGGPVLVAERDGHICAVGLALEDGFISLLYVAPDAQRQGMGCALLTALEHQMLAQGHKEAHLISTSAARDFYLAQGWSCSGPETLCLGLPGYPMRKLLQPVA